MSEHITVILQRGPGGHYNTSYNETGEVEVDVLHTCPVCKSGPILNLPGEGIYCHALNRIACVPCWPKLEALGYV
jgi:hypothetical protein